MEITINIKELVVDAIPCENGNMIIVPEIIFAVQDGKLLPLEKDVIVSIIMPEQG